MDSRTERTVVPAVPPLAATLVLFFIALVVALSLPGRSLAQGDDRGQGYEPDDPVAVETLSRRPRFRGFLPTFHDLSAAFPPPRDQGKQGSCVSWSVGYALRGYYHHQRTGTSYADRTNLFSPAYLYNQLVRTPDCEGDGNIVRALTLLRTEGIASLADFPYDERSCVRKPDDDIRRRASAHTIVDYRAFGQPGLPAFDDIKGSLLAGHPVVVGLNIHGKAMSRLTADQIYDLDPHPPSAVTRWS